MAVKKAPVTDASNDDLDDLLGDAPEANDKGLMENKDKEGVEDAKLKKAQDKENKAKEKALEKEAKAKAKAEEKAAKGPKVLKGVRVTFTNKAGETITGMGVLYYVVRMDGKLHYKEASQVTVLENPDVDVPAPQK